MGRGGWFRGQLVDPDSRPRRGRRGKLGFDSTGRSIEPSPLSVNRDRRSSTTHTRPTIRPAVCPLFPSTCPPLLCPLSCIDRPERPIRNNERRTGEEEATKRSTGTKCSCDGEAHAGELLTGDPVHKAAQRRAARWRGCVVVCVSVWCARQESSGRGIMMCSCSVRGLMICLKQARRFLGPRLERLEQRD